MSKDSTGRESGGVEKDLRNSMSDKPSEGAMRAAESIAGIISKRVDGALVFAQIHTGCPPITSTLPLEIAQIIDQETAAPELLRAAITIIDDAEAGMMDEFEPHDFIKIPNRMLIDLRSAIAKAKGT